MKILGIDPGSRITGYGILEVENIKVMTCLDGGAIRLLETSFPKRLGQLFTRLIEVIEHHRPTVMAIEQVFVHQNVQSALKLGHARGVAIAAASLHHIPVFEYAPRLVKKTVVGYGAAEKHQIQQMVRVVLNLNKLPQADCADALAIALCHAYHVPLLQKGIASENK